MASPARYNLQFDLQGTLVDQDADIYDTFQFRPSDKRALQIVDRSLPFGSDNIPWTITVNNAQHTAHVLMTGTLEQFDHAASPKDVVDSVEWNYGEGAADGYMEGNIFYTNDRELWLTPANIVIDRIS